MSKGVLLIVGGAEDKERDCEILKKFVELSGSEKAKIVVFTTATNHPEEVGAKYRKVLESLGCPADAISTIHTETREDSNRSENLDLLNEATGVFFTGGDQYKIVSLIGGTKTDILLHEKFDEGLIVAGTSAGASMMSGVMILEGSAHETPTLGMVTLGSGLEFLPGVIIDQHFSQRGRTNRLLSVISRNPHHLGIGIDENTALMVHARKAEVLGEGTVTILDTCDVVSGIAEKRFDGSENISISGVKLHVLSKGSVFDLRSRTAMI